jgi:UDP-glucose 4-epimerase
VPKTILITGGAGYIGSHTAYLLHQLGYQIIIIDNLLHGQQFQHQWARLFQGDFADKNILDTIFQNYRIDAVMHFAAFIEVGESVKKPKEFYENNVTKTLVLLDAMLSHNVKKIIFSSSCAVYGNPVQVPMSESNPYAPINAYGKNKLCVEFILQDYAVAYGLQYVALRYFNAAGCLPEQGLGEQHHPETHVIPLLLRAAMQKKPFKIFGSDYPTIDGTCVRDYIHVLDIAQAHILSYDYLSAGGISDAFNLGSGTGYTVGQLIEIAQEVCGVAIDIMRCDRRPGDAEKLVADPAKAFKILGWQPKHSDLREIMQSAYAWELRPRK